MSSRLRGGQHRARGQRASPPPQVVFAPSAAPGRQPVVHAGADRIPTACILGCARHGEDVRSLPHPKLDPTDICLKPDYHACAVSARCLRDSHMLARQLLPTRQPRMHADGD